ncbi:phytoene desaturase family protein [Krasilnikoviella flava]|uniref:Phytoene desaturase n=1 Tax=Krasilnikoviella flava TaxID=526729 RepID=A0A1T5LYF0_9MICO|nr:phytoene desaturase family protein [Krasilnikoviella flava]SKC81026.1 phytoene desaturase [Krasilnikoviella flava]
MRVVVVGAGIAGLATAGLLAREGHDVEVLERHDAPGGRAGSWERAGFRFDTGPSWYLMPEVFDHWFRLMGSSADDALDLVGLDPAYRVFFEGHDDPLDVSPDRAENVATFEAIEPGAGARLDRYLDSAHDTYDLALRHFLYTTFASWRPFAHREVAARLHRLGPLLGRSLGSRVAAAFQDVRLRQVLGYPAVFLGSSPDRAPSLYHLMSALDLDGGVRYPLGGFARVVAAVAGLAVGAGVTLRTRARATAITTTAVEAGPGAARTRLPAPGSRRPRAEVTGVRWVDDAGREHHAAADVVVTAADLHHVEQDLLPPELRDRSPEWWSRRDPGPGGVLVMLGVRERVPQLAHHSLFFTADWRENFGAIADGRVPDPASLYVCAPSRTDPSVAPPGHENLFLLVPVPADPGLGRGGEDGAGDAAVEAIADAAIDRVAAWAGVPDLRERVVVRRTVGPGDFAADLSSWSGGMLGPAHTLRQSAMFRAGNRSRRVAGLLHAGGSTIPGVGLPMCLISAELAVKRVRGDTSADPLPEPRPALASQE